MLLPRPLRLQLQLLQRHRRRALRPQPQQPQARPQPLLQHQPLFKTQPPVVITSRKLSTITTFTVPTTPRIPFRGTTISHRMRSRPRPAVNSSTTCKFSSERSPFSMLMFCSKIGGGGYGQNLAGGSDPAHIGGSITERLYNMEMELYKDLYGQDSPDMSNFENWGHFSQIVWKSTKSVGCYTQSCPNGVAPYDIKWFTVCNYSPPGKHTSLGTTAKDKLTRVHPGNWGGQYTNVGAPLGHSYLDAPMW